MMLQKMLRHLTVTTCCFFSLCPTFSILCCCLNSILLSAVRCVQSLVSNSVNLSSSSRISWHYAHVLYACSDIVAVCADVIIRHQHSLLTHIEKSLARMSLHLSTHDCIHLSNDQSPFWIQASKQINLCECVCGCVCVCRFSNNLEQFQCYSYVN